MATWQDQHDANLLALIYNFLPPHAVYPARIRRLDYGKYEPFHYEDENHVFMILAHYADKTNILLKYLIAHFDWQSPYGYYEAEPQIWINPSYAIDEILTTSAVVSVPAGGYSHLIELLIWPAVLCEKVRFWVDSATGANIDKFKIEEFYDGAWDPAFTEAFVKNVWQEKTSLAGQQTVSRFRVSFHNNGDEAQNAYLAEFDYQPVVV